MTINHLLLSNDDREDCVLVSFWEGSIRVRRVDWEVSDAITYDANRLQEVVNYCDDILGWCYVPVSTQIYNAYIGHLQQETSDLRRDLDDALLREERTCADLNAATDSLTEMRRHSSLTNVRVVLDEM